MNRMLIVHIGRSAYVGCLEHDGLIEGHHVDIASSYPFGCTICAISRHF